MAGSNGNILYPLGNWCVNNHEKWIDLLMKMVQDVPREGLHHSSRHAAAVVYKRTVAGVGFNKMKTHPIQAKFGKNAHAIYLHSEVDAIINSLRSITLDELRKSTLYVVRAKQLSTNEKRIVQGSSCPCSGCVGIILKFGIQRVVYTENISGFMCVSL